MKTLLITIACAGSLGATLGGCAVYTPDGSVVVDPRPVVVVPQGHGRGDDDDDDQGHGRRPDFCPPGQAKKGNC